MYPVAEVEEVVVKKWVAKLGQEEVVKKTVELIIGCASVQDRTRLTFWSIKRERESKITLSAAKKRTFYTIIILCVFSRLVSVQKKALRR